MREWCISENITLVSKSRHSKQDSRNLGLAARWTVSKSWTFIIQSRIFKQGSRSLAVSQSLRFTILYHKLYILYFKFENFTLSFGRLRQKFVLKCVPNVQHDYISSFNQSGHCSLASSLPLSLLKVPNVQTNAYPHFDSVTPALKNPGYAYVESSMCCCPRT